MSNLEFTGERFIPDINDQELITEHYQRYLSILPVVEGKCVLDIACGEGYGSYWISEKARQVIGVDISEETILNARAKYQRNNLLFREGSVADVPVEDDSVDIVVSFETIEHVDENLQKLFLKEVKRVLHKDGILIISTPNKEVYSDKRNYRNEFHIKEFYKEEFINFLQDEFKYINIYNQGFQVLSLITTVEENENHLSFLGNKKINYDGKYFIAIAANQEIAMPSISTAFLGARNEVDRTIDRILTLQQEEEERNLHIHKLDDEIAKKNNYILSLQQDNKTLTQHKEQLTKTIAQMHTQEEMDDLKQIIRNKEGHIELLLESERAYERDKNTLSYRIMAKGRKVWDFFLPPFSKRRFFVEVLAKVIRHPKLMFHVINPTRIKNFFVVLKSHGMKGVFEWYHNALEIEQNNLNPASNLQINGQLAENTEGTEESKKVLTIEQFDNLVFTEWKQPLVSIIIPVYNQFEYTYNCLKSIMLNSGDVKYEILIANDCSTDCTKDIEKVAKNVRLITTEKNVRFLLNCNNAAKYARGRYILFLNNDTQVQENWLQPLVDLIERDDSIGMVGSKLVYPDGKLQEAGGILWKDASAWNYGNRQDADAPEFNYVKEVDYISGAAIMIKKSLWDEIGGFDEHFAPAYCEDSDLAFEVRKHGYKVMYQPKSVVVHFEGVSNGTDVSSGLKSYQVENGKKFFEKWKDTLEKEHFENGTNVFQARDRSALKPKLLMINSYVPMYDKDAGSRTLYQYLKIFVERGFSVTLLGDNFYPHEPYTSYFQSLGIEVLYGPYYANNWKDWLSENGKSIDYVWMNYPHISIKYIDIIKSLTNAKIIYYGMDLHYLRVQREYEVSHDKQLLNEAQEWKEKEFYIMRKADMSYTLSNIEIEAVHKEDASIAIRKMGIFAYDVFRDDIPRDFENRKDLIFVGGFNHKPNLNAVMWFVKDIFPQILNSINVKFYIVGSNPPQELINLESDNIVVKGFVSDEELKQLYDSCRIAVVPLLFGAGVKGKLLEAMYNGIPIVTTSVGSEGIDGIEEIAEIYDSADEFANAVINMYNSKQRLLHISELEQKYVRNNLSIDAIWREISVDFTD